MQTKSIILDSRQYTKNYPESNLLIKQAIELLNGFSPKSIQYKDNDLDKFLLSGNCSLVNTLSKLLKNENDSLINVALNLSPSYAVTHLIWRCLNVAINCTSDNGDLLTHIFAIPLVLVLGSKSKIIVKDSLNSDLLNDFFEQNNLFDYKNYKCYVSGKLIDSTAIAKIKPSQLYYWVRNIKEPNLWLPYDLSGSSIEMVNEGVFLRFLIGVATKDNDSKISSNTSYANSDNFTKNSIPLMKLINQELQQKGVTLFTIPFSVTNLSDAFLVGDNYRKEIAIQVALSNAIRKIREKSLTPLVNINCHNFEIRLQTFAVEGESKNTKDGSNMVKKKIIENSIWQLNHVDNFDVILNKITTLLHDMRVEWNFSDDENMTVICEND